jgi:diketogulonate reductase-like aldo/keto reductase
MIEGDPDTESRAIETFQLGIDLGMTHIETAELYGNGGVDFDMEELAAAEHVLRHERMAADQALYNLEQRGVERRSLPYCQHREIAFVAHSPFGREKFPSPWSVEGRVLALIAERHGRTPRRVALNFLTRHPGVFAIPKAARPEHAVENAGSVGCKLTDEDIAMRGLFRSRIMTCR